jgi:flavin reductase (DIM6/NTAB) family NADH-FMN oxidoreductase RutF
MSPFFTVFPVPRQHLRPPRRLRRLPLPMGVITTLSAKGTAFVPAVSAWILPRNNGAFRGGPAGFSAGFSR